MKNINNTVEYCFKNFENTFLKYKIIQYTLYYLIFLKCLDHNIVSIILNDPMTLKLNINVCTNIFISYFDLHSIRFIN